VAGPSSDLEAKPATAPTPVESSPTEPTQAPAAAPPAPDEVGAAPGLRRFAVLEPKLAGGSLPTADGLDWLAEKGYKTLIDLRDTSEVQSSFLAEVSRRGLRYISLPITLTSVDRDHVARFHFEISLADARPIYFFDSEGNRAGMLWYIQRMTEKNDSYDPQEASRQAEELGLAAPEFREAARRYLEDAKPRPPAPAAAAAPEQATVPTTTATPPAKPTLASEADPEPGPTPPLPGETGIPARPELLAGPKGEAGIPARPEALRDPNAWRPIVALLLTVMGIPAAYWSRSLIAFRVRSRASLPGPARRLRSLPAGSGE
jgi:protein tyrosine phosphatase (PTP) superfamily phosphohydrolase (DUF442 family)